MDFCVVKSNQIQMLIKLLQNEYKIRFGLLPNQTENCTTLDK